VWFAGQTYRNVIITGTNLNSYVGLEGTNCPVEIQVNMDTGSGSLDVASQSSTQIMAKVKPYRGDPTESACVTAVVFFPLVVRAPESANVTPAASAAGSPCTDQDGNQGITVVILGAPKIKWNDNRISVIRGDDPTPQNAVVGQQIKLKTKPTADNVAALGVSFLTNTWTAGPASGPSNNVGGYKQHATATRIRQTVLTKPDLTTYWLYPQSDNPVTYQYCVNIPGLSAADVANGLNCSLVAKATFNVSGPTATIVPTPKAWHVSRPIPVCNSTGKEQVLIFGKLDPKTSTTCKNVIATSGITFNATVNTLSGSSGQTEWIQVISANESTGDSVLGMPFLVNIGTGLDNFLPYNILSPDPVDATTTSTNDSPSSGLGVDDATLTRTFTAKMYLMWTSQTSGSIPVPLGYVKWEISGTAAANETNTPPWSLTSHAPTKRNFHISQDTGTKTHGLPTWSSLVTNTNSATADEEEEVEQ
jgi:hypothetical protein